MQMVWHLIPNPWEPRLDVIETLCKTSPCPQRKVRGLLQRTLAASKLETFQSQYQLRKNLTLQNPEAQRLLIGALRTLHAFPGFQGGTSVCPRPFDYTALSNLEDCTQLSAAETSRL